MSAAGGGDRLPFVLIALTKGIIDRENDADLWQALLGLQMRVRDYFAIIGLELILDEAEGFAYLRQRPPAEGQPELPRLVARRPLGYAVSLLLVPLRKKLAEFDAMAGERRLILDREQTVDMMRLFLPESANEARLTDRIDAHINRIVDMGFLRRLRGQDGQFEVCRIVKAFVDAQWLAEFELRLTAYHEHAAASAEEEDG